MSRLTTQVALMRLRSLAVLAFTAALISACAGGADRQVDSTANTAAVLSGELVYRQRIAMAPDATIYVRLVDADDGHVVGRQQIHPKGRQVPIAFHIEYDRSEVAADYRHVLLASVRDASGRLRWAADVAVSLPASDTSKSLRVRLAPATFNDQALVDTQWQLQYIEQADGSLAWARSEHPSSIEFGHDGHVGGRAACNSFFADYELGGNGQLSVGQAGATLMACPQPGLAQPFLQLLSKVDRYAISGKQLWLITDDATLVLMPSGTISPEAG